ncbi:MAG TPA: sulfate ABC transporter substrate-binding protein [Gaiella sp.]|nr:sulfate ABC transporter substrate-binding protein [Gaiella sp.]
MRGRLVAAVLTLALGVTLAAATTASARSSDTRLSLVAYSTPREPLAKLIAAFEKTPAGNDVSFSQSYGASGDQARAVNAGLEADIVYLSLAPDVDTLVKSGLVDAKWNRQSYKGIVTNSVVVFAVRDGNPKKLRTWDDLTKPGVSVITPNPFTSGGARWNVMAAYGAWLKQGLKPKQAQRKLQALFENVGVQDKSARDALNTFLSGKGDVLLTYENEAIAAQLAKQPVQYIIPKATILIQNPIAVLKNSENKDAANRFLRYLKTPPAQQIFADYGYRPVVKSVLEANRKKFPKRPDLFTIDNLGLGGWGKVQKAFFDPNAGVMATIERRVGGVTG